MIEQTDTECAATGQTVSGDGCGAREALQATTINAAVAGAVMTEPKIPPYSGD